MEEATEKKERRERGEGRIFLNGKGKVLWIQYYDAAGRQRRESSKSKTLAVAERLLARRLMEKDDGTLAEPSVKRLTHREMRDAYIDSGSTKMEIRTSTRLRGWTVSLRIISRRR